MSLSPFVKCRLLDGTFIHSDSSLQSSSSSLINTLLASERKYDQQSIDDTHFQLFDKNFVSNPTHVMGFLKHLDEFYRSVGKLPIFELQNLAVKNTRADKITLGDLAIFRQSSKQSIDDVFSKIAEPSYERVLANFLQNFTGLSLIFKSSSQSMIVSAKGLMRSENLLSIESNFNFYSHEAVSLFLIKAFSPDLFSKIKNQPDFRSRFSRLAEEFDNFPMCKISSKPIINFNHVLVEPQKEISLQEKSKFNQELIFYTHFAKLNLKIDPSDLDNQKTALDNFFEIANTKLELGLSFVEKQVTKEQYEILLCSPSHVLVKMIVAKSISYDKIKNEMIDKILRLTIEASEVSNLKKYRHALKISTVTLISKSEAKKNAKKLAGVFPPIAHSSPDHLEYPPSNDLHQNDDQDANLLAEGGNENPPELESFPNQISQDPNSEAVESNLSLRKNIAIKKSALESNQNSFRTENFDIQEAQNSDSSLSLSNRNFSGKYSNEAEGDAIISNSLRKVYERSFGQIERINQKKKNFEQLLNKEVDPRENTFPIASKSTQRTPDFTLAQIAESNHSTAELDVILRSENTSPKISIFQELYIRIADEMHREDPESSEDLSLLCHMFDSLANIKLADLVQCQFEQQMFEKFVSAVGAIFKIFERSSSIKDSFTRVDYVSDNFFSSDLQIHYKDFSDESFSIQNETFENLNCEVQLLILQRYTKAETFQQMFSFMQSQLDEGITLRRFYRNVFVGQTESVEIVSEGRKKSEGKRIQTGRVSTSTKRN